MSGQLTTGGDDAPADADQFVILRIRVKKVAR